MKAWCSSDRRRTGTSSPWTCWRRTTFRQSAGKRSCRARTETGRVSLILCGLGGASADSGVRRRRQQADRKGDHVLVMGDGLRYGVDHGLTFHSPHELRTVPWDRIGEALSAEELAGSTVFSREWAVSWVCSWRSYSRPRRFFASCTLCPVAFCRAFPGVERRDVRGSLPLF